MDKKAINKKSVHTDYNLIFNSGLSITTLRFAVVQHTTTIVVIMTSALHKACLNHVLFLTDS